VPRDHWFLFAVLTIRPSVLLRHANAGTGKGLDGAEAVQACPTAFQTVTASVRDAAEAVRLDACLGDEGHHEQSRAILSRANGCWLYGIFCGPWMGCSNMARPTRVETVSVDMRTLGVGPVREVMFVNPARRW
jgi:hypothetical protein